MPQTTVPPESDVEQAPSLPGRYPSPPSSPNLAPQRSLARAVYERRTEYTTIEKIRIKIGTWNVAALPNTEEDLAAWFVHGKGVAESLAGLSINPQHASKLKKQSLQTERESVEDQEERAHGPGSTVPTHDDAVLPANDDIQLYVLGLQEIIDISSPTEALKPFVDPHPAAKWKKSAQAALPEGYALVAEQQLNGLLLLVYASPSLTGSVTSVSVSSVGTGLMGYLGNKGATASRIVIGDMTRLVFVNSHLAAGADRASLDRRNWDAGQILARAKFGPVEGDFDSEGRAERVGDEDYAFWFGDLNYRLDDIPGDDVRRLLLRHAREQYAAPQPSLTKINRELGLPTESLAEISQPTQAASASLSSSLKAVAAAVRLAPSDNEEDSENNPASLQTTLASLLPHDQLHAQMRQQRAFHEGWQEGTIKFLPTYKYDVGSVGMFDSSEKHRGPSWCDRILYRTRRQREAYLEKRKVQDASRARDQQMRGRGLDGDDILFDYNPETDGTQEDFNEYESNKDMDEEATTLTGDGDTDNGLDIQHYVSHQRVLSSDHKPISAVFRLEYRACDASLKAKISQEVAKELDKAENETRPGVTVDVEGSEGSVDFGDVCYAVLGCRTITVANTSQVRTTFGFHNGQDETARPRSWLDVQLDPDGDKLDMPFPHEYTMDPGETVRVRVIAHVKDMEHVRRLNSGSARLEDVLVLSVKYGRDHFISVHARWLATCFGMSLDELSVMPDGVVRQPEGVSPNRNKPARNSAPRQLFRLAEALEAQLERAVADWNMKHEAGEPPWSTSGWPFAQDSWTTQEVTRNATLVMVRDALDCGTPFEFPDGLPGYQKVEVLAECIVRFIDAIDGGIINGALWAELSHALTGQDKSKQASIEDKRSLVLETLAASPASSVSFTYIVFTLARIANEVAPLRSSMSSPPPTPRTADGLLRRARGLSHDPVSTKRKEVDMIYGSIFAQAMFKVDSPSKAKDRRLDSEHQRGIINIFLQGTDDAP